MPGCARSHACVRLSVEALLGCRDTCNEGGNCQMITKPYRLLLPLQRSRAYNTSSYEQTPYRRYNNRDNNTDNDTRSHKSPKSEHSGLIPIRHAPMRTHVRRVQSRNTLQHIRSHTPCKHHIAMGPPPCASYASIIIPSPHAPAR